MTGVSRLIIALPLSACLMIVASLAAPRGIANFHFYPINNNLERWVQFDGRTGTSDAHNQYMENKLLTALQWDPENPDIIEAHGQLLDRSVHDKFFWERDTESVYRKALEDFRRVARFRPVSPWTWINIALIKARLKEYDIEMDKSMVNATLLGSWEPLVNIRVADIGLAKWGRLSGSAVAAVTESIRRGLRQSPGDILQIARNHRKIAFLCEQFGTEMVLDSECRQKGR